MADRVIEEQLECPVCFERFGSRSPKILPCQHTFCNICVNQLLSNGCVQCPECRTSHRQPSGGFPNNITIQRLLEAANHPTVPTSTPTSQVQRTVRPNQIEPTAPPMSPPPLAFRMPVNTTNYAQTHTRGDANNTGVQRHHSQQAVSVYEAQGAAPANRINRRHEEISEESACTWPIVRERGNHYFQKCRQAVRKVMRSFLNTYKKGMAITICFFLVITFSRFVAGAVKFGSDCPKERNVAVYLFVKSIFGFIFWGVMAVLGFKERLIRSLDNLCVEIFVVVETVFSVIWLVIGTVWIIGNYKAMKDECPLFVVDWNAHFINFAMFLTVTDYIGLFAFVFYALYTICDNSEEGTP